MSTAESLAKGGVISPDIARMILVLAWTGCRISEIRVLKWSHVEDDEIRIEQSVWKRMEKGTKQNEPRVLPKVEPLRKALDEQRKWLIDQQHPGLASGLVFPADPKSARAGKTRRNAEELSWYRARSCLTKPLELVCRESEVPDLAPHALRRSFEKLLRRADVDGLVRRSLAGWSSTAAQHIYSDVDAEDRASALGAVIRLVER